jgi:TonB family protein
MSGLPLLLESTVKVSIILGAALIATTLLRRHSAAVRHWVLAAAVVCAAATPLLQPLLPNWSVRPGAAAPSAPRDRDQPAASVARADVSTSVHLPVVAAEPTPAAFTTASTAIGRWAVRIWLAGVGMSGFVLLIGFGRLAWLAARAEHIVAGRWADAVAELSRSRGLRRPPTLLQSAHPTMLVTWGVVRPKVILPATAVEWSDDRMRIVLSHELAHVQRGDWPAQIAAEILRTVYWFDPLVWMARARLRQESEHACDDAVLGGGVEASEYAAHLLCLARALRSPRLTWFPAPAMACPSGLERRISAMLNTRRSRAPLGRTGRIAIPLGLLALTLPVAGFGQGAFGALTGTVTDQTGGVIPKTSFVLTHVPTNTKYTVQSAETGSFDFVGLRPGEYVLDAWTPGFRTLRERLTIASGQTLHRTIALQVASLQETISIRHSDGGADTGASTRPPDSPERLAALAQRIEAARNEPCTPAAVGGRIRPPMKIADTRPIYPSNLRGTGVEGPTTMQAVIGTDGFVQDVRILNATHPDLADAAADAVRQWRFTPTLLNCVPIEVEMAVTATFTVEP